MEEFTFDSRSIQHQADLGVTSVGPETLKRPEQHLNAKPTGASESMLLSQRFLYDLSSENRRHQYKPEVAGL